MVWIYFIAVSAVIIWAGSRLSIYADQLAGLLKLSRSAVGILLVSFVTTLPELSTTLGAVIQVGQLDLALGNNLGSVFFNLMIIAICDILLRKSGLARQASGQSACIVHSMLLTAGVLAVLTIPNAVQLGGFRFAAGSPLIILAYIAVFFITQRSGSAAHEAVLNEFEKVTDRVTHPDRQAPSPAKALTGFAVSALVVVASGIALASIGDQIAATTGFGRSFVGTLFLAVATSLPELSVGITAVRIGAYDLMIGNVAGANMLNVLVIAVADLVHRREALHIPDNLSRGHLVTGALSLLAALIVLAAMKQKKPSRFPFGWESVAMLAVYAAGLWALYAGLAG